MQDSGEETMKIDFLKKGWKCIFEKHTFFITEYFLFWILTPDHEVAAFGHHEVATLRHHEVAAFSQF